MTGLNPAVTVRPHRTAFFGLSWSVATQVVTTAIRVISTMVLTRLLLPEAYALLGTAMVVLTTLDWLSDLGVTPSLVRHPRGAEADWLLVGWWLNLKRGFLISGLVVLLAYPLGAAYHQPEMILVLLALAARPVLFALRSPGVPLLRRQLEYRALFLDELTQVLVGLIVSLTVAWFVPNASAWALVAGTLAGALSGVLMTYWLAPMWPRWCADPEARRELTHFGWGVLLNTLMMAIWLNADRLVAPRYLALETMGLFFVAVNLAFAAESLLGKKLEVYLAMLSRQPAGEQAAWHTAHAWKVTLLLGPILALGINVSPKVVQLLYDPRYANAGILLAALMARLVFRTAGQLDFQFLMASGHLRPAIIANGAGAVVQLLLIIPMLLAFGVYGLLGSLMVTTITVTAVQALLSAELRSGFYKRFALLFLWCAFSLGVTMWLS
jgi:O-antigen/teichoic acid export membrane protein